jgi:hypothetical protein
MAGDDGEFQPAGQRQKEIAGDYAGVSSIFH